MRNALKHLLYWTLPIALSSSVTSAGPLTVTVTRPQPAQSEGFKMGQARRPDGTTLTLDNYSLRWSGKPWTPVMGEFHYARYADLLGLRGIRVESPDDLGSAWDEALAADRPVVVDAVVDPEVPPLPPHITFEQAKGYVSSILKGDPARGAMIVRSWRDAIESYLPHKDKK